MPRLDTAYDMTAHRRHRRAHAALEGARAHLNREFRHVELQPDHPTFGVLLDAITLLDAKLHETTMANEIAQSDAYAAKYPEGPDVLI